VTFLRLLLVVLLLSASCAYAETLEFWANRFGGLTIDTTARTVRIFQGNKQGEEIIFHSRLKETSPGTFATPAGTIFTITKLPQAVINDCNRKINSGRYNLRISGGREYQGLVQKLPFTAFGDPNLGWFGGLQ
jgi:hypothetical protein